MNIIDNAEATDPVATESAADPTPQESGEVSVEGGDSGEDWSFLDDSGDGTDPTLSEPAT